MDPSPNIFFRISHICDKKTKKWYLCEIYFVLNFNVVRDVQQEYLVKNWIMIKAKFYRKTLQIIYLYHLEMQFSRTHTFSKKERISRWVKQGGLCSSEVHCFDEFCFLRQKWKIIVSKLSLEYLKYLFVSITEFKEGYFGSLSNPLAEIEEFTC